MKKLFYLFALIILSSLAITACTEEEIAPSSELNGGGNGSDPK